MEITGSFLDHTWLFDIDGTILKHNGHLNGHEEVLPGVHEFWSQIPDNDIIVLLSARPKPYQTATLEFLENSGLRFDYAIFGLPSGERFLFNDDKPKGLETCKAFCLKRDAGLSDWTFIQDSSF